VSKGVEIFLFDFYLDRVNLCVICGVVRRLNYTFARSVDFVSFIYSKKNNDYTAHKELF
jgi:hypothetical protein